MLVAPATYFSSFTRFEGETDLNRKSRMWILQQFPNNEPDLRRICHVNVNVH